MTRLPIITKCVKCGSSEVSDVRADLTYYGVVGERKIICWHCGACLHAEQPQFVGCAFCAFAEAVIFYDEFAGVVTYCSNCGRQECSGLDFREYWKTVACAQCGNPEAQEHFNGYGTNIRCYRCGRFEETDVVEVGQADVDDEDQEWNGLLGTFSGWKRQVHFGAGCLRFQVSSGYGFKCLHTEKEVAEAENETREKLRRGEYLAEGTYLTRWNTVKRQAEAVIGELRSDLLKPWPDAEAPPSPKDAEP